MSTLTLPAPGEVLSDLDAAPSLPEDHEPLAHVVPIDELAEGLVNGTAVTALCGHRFKPKMFNPDDLPVCGPCRNEVGRRAREGATAW